MFIVLPACSNSNVLSTLSYFKTIISLILYVVPSILIVVSGFKLFKIVTSSDPDLKKGMGEIIGKMIGFAAIFFIPMLVTLLTDVLAESGVGAAKDYSECLESATKENIAYYKEKEEAQALLEQEKLKAEKKKADEERKALEKTREKARKENEKRAEEAKKKKEEEKKKGSLHWNPNNVTEVSNVTSTQLVKTMNSRGGNETNFVPYATDFVNAENKYSINAFFLVGLNGLESGWFTGSIARGCNNIGSVCEHAGRPSNGCGCNSNCCFAYFSSVGDSIDYTCSMLKKNYLTPGGTYYEGLSLTQVYTIHYCPGCNDAGKIILDIANSYYESAKKG